MDENKRDELCAEETSADIEAKEAPAEESVSDEIETKQSGDELMQELEEIRDMFQQELDKAAESENEEAPIQELEDMPEDDGEEGKDGDDGEDKPLCECCGEKPRSEEYGEDYPYCEDCRNLMKKYPLRASGVLMTLVMIAVFAVSVFASAQYAEGLMTVSEAAAYNADGRIMTAMTGYYSYITSSEKDKLSMKAFKDLIDNFIKTGYYNDAVSIIESLYDEDDLKLPWNKKYAKLIADSQVLTESYYKVAEIIDDVMNGKEYDYDKVIAELDALHEARPMETGDSETVEKYDPMFIEYYKYVVMSIHGESNEDLLQQLKKVDEVGGGDKEWAYLANYCAIAARCGDGELVDELYDRLIATNKEDVNAYIAKASYYRYLETPDPDKIIEVCNEAKENVGVADSTYMTYLAIAYLLKDEGATALDTMTEYMNSNAYTVEACNLYALCAAYNGNEDIYNEMKDTLESAGYELSDLVEKYKAGKLTVEEVLADKGGEI